MKFSTLTPFILAAGTALLVSACTSDRPNGNSARISPGRWDVVSIAGVPVTGKSEKDFPYLNVEGDGSVSGYAGCNRLRTHLTETGTGYRFEPVLSTKMYCPGIELENRFTDALRKVASAEGAPRTMLRLFDAQHTEVLVLQRAVPPKE